VRDCNDDNAGPQQPRSNLSQFRPTLPIRNRDLPRFPPLRRYLSPPNHFPLEATPAAPELHQYILIPVPGPTNSTAILPTLWNAFPYLPAASLVTIFTRLQVIDFLLTSLRVRYRRYLTNLQRGVYAGVSGREEIQHLEVEFTRLANQARIYISMTIIVEASRLQYSIDSASLMGRVQRDDIVAAGTIVRQRLIDIGVVIDEVLPRGLSLINLPVDARRPREEQDFMRATSFARDAVRWLTDGFPIGKNRDMLADFRKFVTEGDDMILEEGEIKEEV
jgi:hypothetical protein